jgi:linoleate 10R-lipoxygenase
MISSIQEATRLTTTTTLTFSSKTTKIPERVILDLSAASVDSSVFTTAASVDLKRPANTYLSAAPSSPLQTVAQEISDVAIVSVAKVVFGLKNLRRSSGTYYPGWQSPGNLYSIASTDGQKKYLSEDWSSFSPFPVTMKVQWDGA